MKNVTKQKMIKQRVGHCSRYVLHIKVKLIATLFREPNDFDGASRTKCE
jgi:hypothetical protein